MVKTFERVMLAGGFMGALAMPATPVLAQDGAETLVREAQAEGERSESGEHGLFIRVDTTRMDFTIQGCSCFPTCLQGIHVVLAPSGS